MAENGNRINNNNISVDINKVTVLLLILLGLSLAANAYFVMYGKIKYIDVPVFTNTADIQYPYLINTTLLLNYQVRADIICSINNFGNGEIVIDSGANEVYVLCTDYAGYTKKLNLTIVEITGPPSLIVR